MTTATATASALEVQSVSKSFGGLKAVNAVSLTVKPGEIFSVIGPNGAGKTTFFNLLTGIYEPDEGSVRFFGKDITGMSPDKVAAHGIGRTFQNIRLFAAMTVLFLPTYAATAWYHKKLSPELQKKPLHAFLEEVEAFAGGEYLRALFKGSALPEAEREGVLEKLSRYSGLSREYLEQTNLRINIYRFCKELLRSERKTVGRLDSRFTGHDRDAAGEHSEYDPSYATIQGPYTATFNQYVREELGFESDLPYEVLTGLYQDWSYKEYENQYLNVAETLRKAMNLNPYLKVFVGSGYYDLATPYFATDYTFAHLGLEPHLQANIQTRYYAAGHMMYVHRPSLEQMKQDLAAFVAAAAPGTASSSKGKPRP